MLRQILLVTLIGITTMLHLTAQQAGDPRWSKVNEAKQKGLPQTALKELEPILSETAARKLWPEHLRALLEKVSLQGYVQGGRPEEKILSLEAVATNLPTEVQPIVDTILARYYWQYYSMNRWKFMQRTSTEQTPGNDFTTWDLPRLFGRIDSLFARALRSKEPLQRVPITQYDAFLEKGTVPDSFRPTLYDFLAHEALAFYTASEQAASHPQDRFEFTVDSGAFSQLDRFLRWKPDTTDTNSPSLRAILLYQDLLRFHRDDDDPSALLDADLNRLLYVKNAAVGEGASARFREAASELARRYSSHEHSSTILYHVATTFQEDQQLSPAHEAATRGAKAYPQSPGAAQCRNLLALLEAREASIETERVWSNPQTKIQVSHRNVSAISFRLYKRSWSQLLVQRRAGGESLELDELQRLLPTVPVFAWSNALPKTKPYELRSTELPIPTRLPPGFYTLVASPDPSFTTNANRIAATGVWVSRLALVTRSGTGNVDGLVTDAESGEPIANAVVTPYRNENNGSYSALPSLTTDTNGWFSLEASASRNVLFHARWQDQEVSNLDALWMMPRGSNRIPKTQITQLFTDRAIYRPGQILYYKGICLSADPSTNSYQTVANQDVTVAFLDANGKEIARLRHRSNKVGSFSGSFTTPRDRLMGRMRLSVVEGFRGQAWVNVEEYKRPKFQVTFEPPKEEGKLREKTTVQGQAMTYAGAPVDDALVQYRVVREVRMPWWWGWFGGRGSGFTQRSAQQEISHGTVRTSQDGSFSVSFTAQPDGKVPEKDEPTFVFRVHADVTDSAGETRSAEHLLHLGYKTLQARIEAPTWMLDGEPTPLSIRTTDLGDQPLAASGKLTVYSLQPPPQVQRPRLLNSNDAMDSEGAEAEKAKDLSDPNNWPLGRAVYTHRFRTDTNGLATTQCRLPAGAHRVVVECTDRFGRPVTSKMPLMVNKPGQKQFGTRVPFHVAIRKETLQPGEDLLAIWGTGYSAGRALVEIEHRSKVIQRYWTTKGITQDSIQFPVSEQHRGGFTLRITQVRENRLLTETKQLSVPWSNKELLLSWEHFTSKMTPGQLETWSLIIRPNPTNAANTSKTAPSRTSAVEMAATLYDASLDAFLPHSWPSGFTFFYRDMAVKQVSAANRASPLDIAVNEWNVPFEPVDWNYRRFPGDLGSMGDSPVFLTDYRGAKGAMPAMALAPQKLALAEAAGMGGEARMMMRSAAAPAPASMSMDSAGGEQEEKPAPTADIKPALRKNLQETAFFYPQLLADSNGVIRMQFTMPEALTEWKFLGFAHDKECRSGLLSGKATTSRDLMVQPNPPRFLREGDVLEFTVKISNQGSEPVKAKATLHFVDPVTQQNLDAALRLERAEQTIQIAAKSSKSLAWKLTVPDGLTALSYQASASSDKVADGEEGMFPVLPRRILVRESIPLAIRGPGKTTRVFERLAQSQQSASLQHQSLTLQMVSNPAWYAVMALPYLMEFPHACSEQTFNRLYANALARHIAKSDPMIRRVFDQWRGTAALDSPLEKNQDLKSVLLEETPWWRQAQKESEARRNVGLLFEENRMNSETDRALDQLAKMQLPEGAWPWFSGGRANEYITLYITAGFGRLRHLGVQLNVSPALRAIDYLDRWILQSHQEILRRKTTEENHLTPSIALYIYARSLFLKDRPIPPASKVAIDYFVRQGRTNWLKLGSRQAQAHVALGLWRWNDQETPPAILASLKERSVTDPELGRFWRDTESGWWWYHAPIETQAMMIEAFHEIAKDPIAEECKVWLLKQKQTQDWKTTKATADAVYALLLRGTSGLADSTPVQVTLGGIPVKPETTEAGTGFFEKRFGPGEIKPSLGQVVLEKPTEGVAWGGLHWQYFEDMESVKTHEATSLKLTKRLFLRKNTNRGPVLTEARGILHPGDEIVVRLELRTDRDMEYVHLKDQRGSGTEPSNVLSGYRYQDGLGYYESTRDAASHFFIDYLRKGTYIFEYAVRVVHRGRYQTGMAQIQCMYAPEFSSHSESIALEVVPE
jgi:hypothetical protein